ncbi:hypothetical protein L873DRAFT_1797015 [Choiromyces venosus 120613-1]|uniref:Uncharacterized protein n=1 Tax=Choiromyces venosus 120613-1 TaxID=1336337 RepID=A0A3N4K9R7_9PEZI|nr:hypothetical protein L873DRAFT_1797015 [Choiromyces venosus 120613-1]
MFRWILVCHSSTSLSAPLVESAAHVRRMILLFSSPLSSFPTNNLSRKYDRAIPSDFPFLSPGFRNFLSLLPKN